jgi:dihydroxyacetone kinase-like predicted kinase
LEILRRAGVVDAGGRGYLLLIEVLADVLAGQGTPPRRSSHRPAALPVADLAACGDIADDGPGYEVMYLLDTEAEDVDALRSRLSGLGDSLVVVGGGGLWHVHVHVDDAGAAIEAGLAAGRIHQVRVTHFAEQVGRRSGGRPRAEIGLVACAAGPGLAAAFAEAGAVVVRGWPVRRPSTAQILGAVREAHAATVVVLPNDRDTLATAEAAAGVARQEGIRVSVLPTRTQVQGLAAAAVHDPGRGADDDVVRMTAAAGAARAGAVTVAIREAITSAGLCRPGDVLGVVDGDFVLIGDDLARTAIGVVDRLLSSSSDLITLVTGADADPGLLVALREHLHGTRLDVEVCVLDGGQERYPLLIGVE